jgi:hypothetical protein
MIIELIGLPGSGKTYIANKVVDSIQEERTLNVTQWSRISILGRVEKKIIYLMNDVCPTIRMHKSAIRQIVGHTYQKSLFGLYDNIKECIDMLSVNLFIESKYAKMNGIYLFDEGALHSISKLYGDFEISDDTVKQLVRYCLSVLELKPNQIVYNNISLNEDVISIKQRNRKACRFDYLSEEQLVNILKRYKKSCEIIRALTNPINIERNEPDDIKISRIKEQISRK